MICCKTRAWGNSIGVIIPNEVRKELALKPDEEICLEITRKPEAPLKELFGSGRFKQDTKEMLREARQNESKFI